MLTGNIICFWFPEVHELGIKAVKMCLTNAEIEPVTTMINKYLRDKAAERRS